MGRTDISTGCTSETGMTMKMGDPEKGRGQTGNHRSVNECNIAVLIPCYNEETTISAVVSSFARVLPKARIIVFDNNSSDDSVMQAEKAGAEVVSEPRQGKGNVVRAMFRKIDADIYVLVDGDNTYPANQAVELIGPLLHQEADMVVGDRLSSRAYDKENKRKFHSFGNRLVRRMINLLFGSRLKDIMSGYRVFSRVFVKTFPVLSEGFEIETELTLHALDKRFPIVEIPIDYRDRPAGSVSKLSTFSDGSRILKTIAKVFKNYKPLHFFTACAGACCLAGLFIGIFPIMEYIRYSYVYKVPSAILAAALEILAMLLFSCGIILDTIVQHQRENYELTVNQYYQQAINEKRG